MDMNINGNDYQLGLVADANGSPVPNQATGIAPSGDVANAIATATLAAVAGKTNYLAGALINGTGATAAGVVLATITGLQGGTITVPVAVAAGATVGNAPIALAFNPPLKAAAANQAIVLTVPALGAGNLHSTAHLIGATQ